MRAPLCNESSDLCPEEKGRIISETESEDIEICSVERSLNRSGNRKATAFGICLDDLMGTETQVVPQIPFILSRLCRYIETHGLHHKSLFLEKEENNIVESLRLGFVECGDAALETIGNVASATRLLVIFFEELPEPLIPVSVQPDFVKDMEELTLNSCIDHLKGSVGRLPDSTYQVLKYLSCFLLRVTCHKEYNGMGSDNLAIIFAPIIFRSTSSDPALSLTLKNIVNYFVKDYHSIFEDMKSNLKNEGNLNSSLRVCRQLPCPSSVMPIASLSPLSVYIPSLNENVPDNDSVKDGVPVLLIERKIDVPAKENRTYSYVSTGHKDNGGVHATRKRKERRLSGEDPPPRSSSEERPNPSAVVAAEQTEAIRRCNSHEEVMEDNKAGEDPAKFSYKLDKAEKVHLADSFSPDSMELISEKNHSPHPPNAKRREVDTEELNSDCLKRWNCPNLSKFTEPAPPSDVPCHRNSEQNLIAEFTEEKTMECEVWDEEENEYLECKSSAVPRSASCPMPKSSDSDESESASSSLSLSWSMLFEDSEPVRAENPLTRSKDSHEDALLSPSIEKLRNSHNFYEAPLSPSAFRSYLSHRSSHLDSSVPPSPPVEQEDFAKKLVESSGVSESVRQLTKKIHNIKRRIRKFDEKFEVEFGYKPSHAEKSNNPEAKKLLSDLYKTRKELKALKEEAHLEHVSTATSSWYSRHVLGDTTNLNEETKDKSKPTIKDSYGESMKMLADDRKTARRPEEFEDMSNEQVKDEKMSIQKALLHFESIHGKPFEKDERKTIRPLYDRYRNVKRLLVRSGSFTGSAKNDLCGELQPILEHETMDFPSREKLSDRNSAPVELEKSEPAKESPAGVEKASPEDDSKSSSSCLFTKYDNSNFHELPLSEMIFQMQKVKSEKRHLRRILKEFETEFLRLNARKVQKEDKAPFDSVYSEYKHVKARLKLLEALISKHDQHQLM